MDFAHPLEAVIPGARGRILRVLVNVGTELNMRTIARLGGVSVAQASRMLPELVELGLVERREVPPSSLFRLNRDHVAARALMEIADARNLVLAEMATQAARIEPAPVSVIVFGSFARGDDQRGSDIDVVVVRPTEVDMDDDRWIDQLEQWRRGIRRVSGNAVEVIDVDVDEAAGKLAGHSQLWRDVRRDGVVVFGEQVGELVGRASA